MQPPFVKQQRPNVAHGSGPHMITFVFGYRQKNESVHTPLMSQHGRGHMLYWQVCDAAKNCPPD